MNKLNPVTTFLNALATSSIVPHNKMTSVVKPSDAKLKEAVVNFCSKTPVDSLPKTTHYIFILDGSGSMQFGKDITVNGYNEQRKTIIENVAATGETYITFIDFNTSVTIRCTQTEPQSAPVLTVQNYETVGGTALHDAIGVAIETALSLKNIEGRDTGVLISILTDGEENSSGYVSGKVLGECVNLLENSGKFTFALMGPKAQLETMAQVLNVKSGNISGFDPVSLGSKVQGMADMTGATMAYSSARSMNLTASNNLYEKSKLDLGTNSDKP